MPKFIISFIALVWALGGSTVAHAEMLKNAGFTGTAILTNSDAPIAGETVRLSMPVYNESKGIITGVVRLYEGDKKLAEKSITLRVGEFSGVSFEWKAITGLHTFKLRFEDTMIQYPKEPKEIVVLEQREASALLRTQGAASEDGALFKEYPVVSESQNSPTSGGIDAYRQDFLTSAENKISAIRKDISESVRENEEYKARLTELRSSLPRADGSLLTPLQYLYAWALGAIAYILSNKYLFYGVSALLVFLLLRFLIRRLHHHRHPYAHK